MNELQEGWGKSPYGEWHYYAGISGLGGRYRSLCGYSSHPVGRKLQRGLPAKRCASCALQLARADRTSTPREP